MTDANQGAAYVFVKPAGGRAGPQTESARLIAGAGGDEFGYSVAIRGYTIVVGAPFADIDSKTDQGAAFVFGCN